MKYEKAAELLKNFEKRFDSEPDYWYILGIFEMKKTFKYQYALQYMNEAKKIDYENETTNKEIRKLEKLEKGMNSDDNILSIKYLNQPSKSVQEDDIENRMGDLLVENYIR